MDEEELLRLSKEFIRTGNPKVAEELNDFYLPHFPDNSCSQEIAPFGDTFVMIETHSPPEGDHWGKDFYKCNICQGQITKGDKWIDLVKDKYHLRCIKEVPDPKPGCRTCNGAYLKSVYLIRMGVDEGVPCDIYWGNTQSYRLLQRLYLECTRYDLLEQYEADLYCRTNIVLDPIQGKIIECIREHLPKEITSLVMRFLLGEYVLSFND